MNVLSRSLAVLVTATAIMFTLGACGDDSVNPSSPDASSGKDAAVDAGEAGHDGEASSPHPDAGDEGQEGDAAAGAVD